MDDSKNQAGNARLLNMPGRRDQMLRTMLLCALTAAIFFLPFYIIDGGFFHYAGDFNSQQISFYRYMNGFIKGAGYPDGMARRENSMRSESCIPSHTLQASEPGRPSVSRRRRAKTESFTVCHRLRCPASSLAVRWSKRRISDRYPR